jgi:hypothetical protein
MYGGTDNYYFALKLYQNVLGRAPDAEGLAYWVNRLNEGMPRENVILSFTESLENKVKP